MERVPVQQSRDVYSHIHTSIESSLPAYIDPRLCACSDPGFCNCLVYLLSTLGPEPTTKIRDIGSDV
jgi:hypothetical protein